LRQEARTVVIYEHALLSRRWSGQDEVRVSWGLVERFAQVEEVARVAPLVEG
jgi:hypothetical protein